MGKREDALKLLREGKSPGAIRQIQGVTLTTILGYLHELVGRGEVRRSDILFSVPLPTRRAVFQLIAEEKSTKKDPREIARQLKSRGIEADADDVEVALQYQDDRFAFGDMYDDIRTIELGLHRLIRESLESAYGSNEWWRQGVPLSIRQKCVARREEDDDPADHPYVYADLLDLCKVAEKEWKIVGPQLPKELATNRKGFVGDIEQLNRIRRMVMHPVRGPAPSEDDFQFVHELKRKLNFLSSRSSRPH